MNHTKQNIKFTLNYYILHYNLHYIKIIILHKTNITYIEI